MLYALIIVHTMAVAKFYPSITNCTAAGNKLHEAYYCQLRATIPLNHNGSRMPPPAPPSLNLLTPPAG